MSFTIGQRWISHADLELGLGICVETDNRRVTLLYPSAEEERTYATDRAPLTRYQLKIGDRLVHINGRVLEVTQVDEIAGTLSYETIERESGETFTVHEQFIAPEVSVNTPQDRLLNNQLDKVGDFNLRYHTLSERARLLSSDSSGLIGARTSLLSHQLYVASEVGSRFAPRVLLADEVGLGKTIEAGLILTQQILRGRVQRCLVAVPDPLLHQWLVEMLRRFNLQFAIYDEARLDAEAEEFDFENDQLVLIPWSFIQQNKSVTEQLLASEWDFLIVDEAHHLNLGDEAKTAADRALTTLAVAARGLLLLTATPGQSGIDSHFFRLKLLDSDRFNSFEQFIEEQKRFEETHTLIEALRKGEATPELPGGIDPSLPTDEIAKALVDQYGTGRVLFRNSRKSVQGFPKRHLHHHALPKEYATDIGDSKRPKWLAELLKSLKYEKVLVICRDKSTAMALEHYLHLQVGIRCASFHEDLSLIERDRAAAYFSDAESGARALICSEIGSEGRNFQFAQHLVCYDLPAHPDLLEQRIGRLDRIGQRGVVNIHVPVSEGSVEDVRFRWFHDGLDAFETSCSIGHLIYSELRESLLQCEENGRLSVTLLQQTIALKNQLSSQMDRGRDRLLEITSHDPVKAAQLIATIEQNERTDSLVEFTDHLFDRLGIHTEVGADETLILKPTANLVTGELPWLDNDGITCTFSRELALSRDDLHFLTWEHPLVRETIDVIYNSELGNATVALINQKSIKPGTVLIETLFNADCPAPKRLQIGRYLDQQPIRYLITLDGRDLSEAIGCEAFTRLLKPISITQSAGVVRELRAKISAALSHLQGRAADRVSLLRDAAKSMISQELNTEVTRLEALGSRNGSVRDDELEMIKQIQKDSLEAVTRAEAKLQGVRVVVAT
ncbi:MAG: helicase-related protein [Pseudomonadota bacterium]|nr:helicase-related protein [Pseudomonadota bacterium]